MMKTVIVLLLTLFLCCSYKYQSHKEQLSMHKTHNQKNSSQYPDTVCIPTPKHAHKKHNSHKQVSTQNMRQEIKNALNYVFDRMPQLKAKFNLFLITTGDDFLNQLQTVCFNFQHKWLSKDCKSFTNKQRTICVEIVQKVNISVISNDSLDYYQTGQFLCVSNDQDSQNQDGNVTAADKDSSNKKEDENNTSLNKISPNTVQQNSNETMVGGFSAPTTTFSQEVKDIDSFIRKELPKLQNATLVSQRQQVISGMKYCLTYLVSQNNREICVWDQPWLDKREILNSDVDDLK